MSEWPRRFVRAAPMTVAFNSWPGHFDHRFADGRLTVVESRTGGSSTVPVSSYRLADGVQLHRFLKPDAERLVHVDLIVDESAGTAVAVHQTAGRIGGTASRLTVERGTLGEDVALGALVTGLRWEPDPGSLELAGAAATERLRIGTVGRLLSPHSGRLVEIAPGLLLVMATARRDTVAAVLHLGHGLFSASRVSTAPSAAPSISFDSGAAVFSVGPATR